MRRILLFSALLFLAFASVAQSGRIDSLKQRLNATENYQHKADLLLSLGREYRFVDDFRAKDYAIRALELCDRIDYTDGLSRSHLLYADMLLLEGYLQEARQQYQLAFTLDSLTDDSLGMAEALDGLGTAWGDQGEFSTALKYHVQSALLNEALNNQLGRARNYGNMAIIHSEIGNTEQALVLYSSALVLLQELGDDEGLAITYTNLGVLSKEQGMWTRAINYFTKCQEIQERHHDDVGLSYTYLNLGATYEALGQADNAIRYLQDALDRVGALGDTSAMGYAYSKLGLHYLRSKQYGKSLDYLQQAASIFRKQDAKRDLADVYRGLSDLHHERKNDAQALLYLSAYTALRDTIWNEQNSSDIARFQVEYEANKRANELAMTQHNSEQQDWELEKRQASIRNLRIIIISSVIGLALIVALSIVIWRGKRKSDELLLNILPHETAQELKKYGYAKARSYDSVTVLFTDFKGFSQIAEAMRPEDLVREIDICFREFDAIMDRFGVEKIKTIGDAYMAAGGLPVTNTTHPQDVIKAALAIQDFMHGHNATRQTANLPCFEVRIGIHTGPVVAGVVGTRKFQYDIWGDTVNTAARLETGGEAGKVNISGDTHILVREVFACTYRGKVEAKNKGFIDMYFVEHQGG